jgi:flagellar biosynthetic protein FlhB
VALKYDAATMAAPQVVSRGTGQFALRLKRLAFVYGVVIVENRELARALYRCELNRPIPDALFQPVAGVYQKLRKKPVTRPSPDHA